MARLEGIVSRAKASRTFLNRNVLGWYRNVQRTRWMTENNSEGTQWTALNPAYKKRKLTQFRGYPGNGNTMLMATGALFKSVIGPGPGFRKVVTDRQLIIGTSIPYASYVDEVRTFTTYGEESRRELLTQYAKFLAWGTING